MKINTATYRILAYSSAILLFFWAGRLSLQYQIHAQLPAMQQVAELNHHVPVFEVLEIKDAQIIGTASPLNSRVLSGDQVAVPDQEGNFSLDISHLGYIGAKRPVIKHKVPDWALFVASKNGKYFYPIDEKQAKRLSVPNRLYFKTEEEARGGGYLGRGD
jgi:hypothetical protein